MDIFPLPDIFPRQFPLRTSPDFLPRDASAKRGLVIACPQSVCLYVKVKVKADIALHGNPISELRDVTWHMESHSVAFHPTQVNAPRLTPAMKAGTRFDLLTPEGWKAELT